MQAYISRARVDSFSLTADLMYVSQNAPRIARALFEICLRRGWSSAAELCLTMSKVRRGGAAGSEWAHRWAGQGRAGRACLRLSPAARPLSARPPQAFELRLWPDQHPLRQFEHQLSPELLRKLEDRQLTLDVLAVRAGCH